MSCDYNSHKHKKLRRYFRQYEKMLRKVSHGCQGQLTLCPHLLSTSAHSLCWVNSHFLLWVFRQLSSLFHLNSQLEWTPEHQGLCLLDSCVSLHNSSQDLEERVSPTGLMIRAADFLIYVDVRTETVSFHQPYRIVNANLFAPSWRILVYRTVWSPTRRLSS